MSRWTTRPRVARAGKLRRSMSFVCGFALTSGLVAAQCELPQLLAPAPDDAAKFGVSLLLHDGEAVVGNAAGLFGDAACYVFEESFGTWSAQAGELKADDLTTSYGYGIARSGDTVIVAGQDINDPTIVGYVFERVAGTWTLVDHLVAPSFGIQLGIGLRVAMEDDVAVVADPALNTCWVFERDDEAWHFTQQLSVAAGAPGMPFGLSVVLQNGRAIVGGIDLAGPGSAPGAAWIFERGTNGFVESAKLLPAEAETDDSSGYANGLAQDADTVVLGSPAHDLLTGEPLSYGAVFVFELQAGAWVQTQMLAAPDGRPGDAFGSAVALQGDVLLVGAPWHDQTGHDSGAVYLYRRDASGLFEFVSKLLDPAAEPNAQFGRAIAVDGDTVLVSAPFAGSAGGAQGVRQFRGLVDLDAWVGLPGGVAGSFGAPCLYGVGTPQVDGSAALKLVQAPPRAAGWIVVGLAELQQSFKGGVLVPAPDFLLPRSSDAFGHAALSWTWPAVIPAGTPFWFQAWLQDPGAPAGFAASGGVTVASP